MQLPKSEIHTAEQVHQVVQHLGRYKQEHFLALYLDARYHLICKKIIAIGTVDALLVHPREVYAPAIQCRASTVIVAHNHPSGDPTPSEPDILTTKQLAEAGKIIDIALIDHLIITKNDWVSMKKQGML